MAQKILFPDLQGFPHIENFFALVQSAIEDEQATELQIDFSPTSFLVPESLLATLCGSLAWFRVKGSRVSIQFHEKVLPYVDRTGFFIATSDFIRPTQSIVDKWSKSGSYNLLELTVLPFEATANSHAVYEVYPRLEDILLGRIKPSQIASVGALVSEVIQNISHSRDQGFVMAQIYQTGAHHRVHIGIADMGLGIPSTLRAKYPNMGTDATYLRHSLESGVTSRDGSAGLGLFTVQRIVESGAGSLTMRSGTGMLQYRNNTFQLYDNLVPFPGTQLYITIWGRHNSSDWQYALT